MLSFNILFLSLSSLRIISLQIDRSRRFALVAHRGSCKFDTKALNAQNAGAEFLIVVDVLDEALQRVGASPALGGFLGLPVVLTTAAAGEDLETSLKKDSTSVSLSLSLSADDSLAKAWIALAFMQLSDGTESEKVKQHYSFRYQLSRSL